MVCSVSKSPLEGDITLLWSWEGVLMKGQNWHASHMTVLKMGFLVTKLIT